ncbi:MULTISPECIES: YceI family protein [Olivibacter]|uniref:YceI family protein n=1 Tax=Olivibacter oleidegradans TaxID=760123 RepID=A0ABV6HMJ0_9SPHI|nr:YceI family protein [Olivibacter jilunii]MDX3914504.1 YceI family protein [Pseudosphingobacterium sp.]
MAKFQIQSASSTVNWTGKKVLGLHTGSINVESGFLELTDHLITNGEIKIDMASIAVTDIEDIKTHHEFLAHLQSEDFFSVDRFKTATLVITGSRQIENSNFSISGNLTIKDITNPISFNAKIEVFTDYLHSMGEIVIDRTAYNIRYGSGKFIDNLGDKLIYDDFVLQFKLIGKIS